MHKNVSLVVVMAGMLAACGKGSEAPASGGSGQASGAGSAPAAAPAPTPAPSPTPAPPPPAPVTLTVDDIKPTCEKIFTPEVIAKTHGATSVKSEGAAASSKGGLIVCQFMKGEESLGSVALACNPELDPTAIQRERAAMTKAKDLPTPVGRGSYRISNSVVLIDDETPCRAMINYMSFPADDAALTESLRAMVAAINPSTLK